MNNASITYNLRSPVLQPITPPTFKNPASNALVASSKNVQLPNRPLSTSWLGYQSNDLEPRLRKAVESIHRAIAEVCVDNNQEQPSQDTIRKAEHLTWLLPNHVPLPTISVEPDGAIAFDWIASRQRMFSMSVSESDKLAYAWLIDDSHGHGIATLSSNSLPEPIPTLLTLVLTRG